MDVGRGGMCKLSRVRGWDPAKFLFFILKFACLFLSFEYLASIAACAGNSFLFENQFPTVIFTPSSIRLVFTPLAAAHPSHIVSDNGIHMFQAIAFFVNVWT